MKNFLPILFMILALPAVAQEKINKGFRTFKAFPCKKLQFNMNDSFSFSAQMLPGKKMVFEYYYKADEDEYMSDDEYVERIYFEVPAGATNFHLHDSTLKAAYLRSCFCMDRGWHRVASGYIHGKKINSKTWEVEISITTEKEPDRSAGPIAVDVQGRFTLQPRPVVKKKTVKKAAPKSSKKTMIRKHK
jgi:hypothetical protein